MSLYLSYLCVFEVIVVSVCSCFASLYDFYVSLQLFVSLVVFLVSLFGCYVSLCGSVWLYVVFFFIDLHLLVVDFCSHLSYNKKMCLVV